MGLAILGPLRQLDEVAYLRFASVYRAFESAADFEDEIAALRAERLAQQAEHAAGVATPSDDSPDGAPHPAPVTVAASSG